MPNSNDQQAAADYINGLIAKHHGDLGAAIADLLYTGFDVAFQVNKVSTIKGVERVTGIPPQGPP
jgi:hypothetical protein